MTEIVYLAQLAVLDGALVTAAWVHVDANGVIAAVGHGPPPVADESVIRDLGRVVLVPGMIDAHSHAFQRAIRGVTQVRYLDAPSSFWGWRDAMYRAANELDPDRIYAITRQAFTEMLAAGITCVGEFHYVHHDVDGRPYDDPNESTRQVLRAATDSGIRVVMLESYYERDGPGQPPSAQQRRFCDGSVAAYLERVDTLRLEGIDVVIAPHSVRAVGRAALLELAGYANTHDLPMHAHVSEQPAENRQCLDEHGITPVQLFADTGCLARPRSFTAVHAIFVTDDDILRLADQSVCVCPTTEADLGDGLVRAGDLELAGSRLVLGSDSNAVIDLIQEARLLEMGERLRTGSRLCLTGGGREIGLRLLRAATSDGAKSLGRADLGRLAPGHPFDACTFELDHPSLVGVEPQYALDAIMLSGTAAVVGKVYVEGRRIR